MKSGGNEFHGEVSDIWRNNALDANSFTNNQNNIPGYGDPADPNGDVRAYQGIGSTFFSDRLRDNTLQFTDYISYFRGRHNLKFGGDFRHQQFNVHQLLSPGGQFNFCSEQTSNCNCSAEGFPVAGLLTGATEFSFNAAQNFDPAWRQLTHSYFVQDDIKVTPRLTVNAGARYDLPGLRTERATAPRGCARTSTALTASRSTRSGSARRS